MSGIEQFDEKHCCVAVDWAMSLERMGVYDLSTPAGRARAALGGSIIAVTELKQIPTEVATDEFFDETVELVIKGLPRKGEI